MYFSKAFFCYLITSRLFALSCGAAIKRSEARKFLDLPIAPAPKSSPHTSTSQSQSESSSDSAIQQDNTNKEPKQPDEP
ncbi:mitochondrial inner membrane protein OXA1-like [Chenopodium quinoa]|uniref:mitochondrial inner membrane protein OXA1-like n=1 Tax=Chenopodium quinoa TaxID=63459 RepID=UPI000B7804FA|nr:mitochondrial inner membrane protein OXA1-like [Chenopodium quinoa]